MPKDNLMRAVSRKRPNNMCLQIPAPTDWHFKILDDFPPFLLQDKGEDDNDRILTFGDATMKNLLSFSNTRFVDGAFILLPDIFHQTYTIHVELQGFATTCVYVLLRNKTGKTYKRMIKFLSEKTNPNPGKTLAHFEKAALKAFSKRNPSRRNFVLLNPSDALLEPVNQWDRIKKILQKIPRNLLSNWLRLPV